MDNIYCGFKKTNYYNGTEYFVAFQEAEINGSILSDGVSEREVFENEIIKAFIAQEATSAPLVQIIESGVNNFKDKMKYSIAPFNYEEPLFKIVIIKNSPQEFEIYNTSDFEIFGVKNKKLFTKIEPETKDCNLKIHADFSKVNVKFLADVDRAVIVDPVIKQKFIDERCIFTEVDFVNLIQNISYENFINVRFLSELKRV